MIEGLRAQIEGSNLAHVELKRQFEAEVSKKQTQAQGAGSTSSGFTQNNGGFCTKDEGFDMFRYM